MHVNTLPADQLYFAHIHYLAASLAVNNIAIIGVHDLYWGEGGGGLIQYHAMQFMCSTIT